MGDIVGKMMHENGRFFETAEYASIQTPTYPCGQIGAFVARVKGDDIGHCGNPQGSSSEETVSEGCNVQKSIVKKTCSIPKRKPDEKTLSGELKYYSSKMHE